MPFHAIATLSGNRQKTIPNRTEEQMLSQVAIPFVANGTITATWGNRTNTYQVLEMRVYETKEKWDKKAGALASILTNKKNKWPLFETKAKGLLSINKPKVFVVTPIQGDIHGTQEQQRILKEFDGRFELVEKVISKYGGVAIRIDRERPIDEMVGRIKAEIRGCLFVVADLTDERPSCYFEAGFAEALSKPIIYIASKQSVLNPGKDTKIHFDVHMNVNLFTNHGEMEGKLEAVIQKNRTRLFEKAEAVREVTGLKA